MKKIMNKHTLHRLLLPLALSWPIAGLAQLPPMPQYQVCHPNVAPTAPTSDFDFEYGPEADGSTVLHLATGLIWQRCLLHQTFNNNGTLNDYTDDTCETASEFDYAHTWEQALQAAADADSGWRLPNIKELASIVEERCTAPALNQTVFMELTDEWGLPYILWTSTPSNATNASHRWEIMDGQESSGNRALQSAVRLVKDAE